MGSDHEVNKRKKGRFLRRVIVVFTCAAVYVLSLGPAIRLTEYKDANGRNHLPAFIEIMYFPLFASPPPFSNWLDEYVKFWIEVP